MKKCIFGMLACYSSLSLAYRGGPPSDHTPFLFFLAILAVWGVIKFFQTNKEIGAVIGGLLLMVFVSLFAAVMGAEIGIYDNTSIMLVGVLIFVVWLFYPVLTKKKEPDNEENSA